MAEAAKQPIHRDLARRVRQLEIVTNRLVNETMAGSYHSSFKGRGMEFQDVREYTPGDDIRSIDWNVTARAGTPFVKRFTEERELTVLIAVDMSGSQAFGTQDRQKVELAAEVCALLAFTAIKNNDRVGLLIFTDEIELFLPPKKGKNHVLRVVRSVLEFKPEGRGTNIATAVEHLMRVQKRKAVVFLLSDFPATEGLRRPLAVLNQTHDLVALRVTDRRELEMPPVGLVSFQDAETGEVAFIDTNAPGFGRRYAEAVAASRAETERTFKKLSIDFADLMTEGDLMSPIVQLFNRRAHRY